MYKKYDIQDRKDRNETFNIIDTRSSFNSDKYTLNSTVTDYKWVMKDVKPLKEENFTSSIDNHIAKIEFQLSYEFSSKMFEKVIGPVFSQIANTFVDAFVRRANEVHGGANG